MKEIIEEIFLRNTHSVQMEALVENKWTVESIHSMASVSDKNLDRIMVA